MPNCAKQVQRSHDGIEQMVAHEGAEQMQCFRHFKCAGCMYWYAAKYIELPLHTDRSPSYVSTISPQVLRA